MSNRAVGWAVAQDLPPGVRWVLYWLADHADPNGEGAWPSKSRLAQKCHTDPKVIQKQLRVLESEGYIVRGDQRHVRHIRANQRPTVWNLNLWRGGPGDLVLQEPLVSALGEPQVPGTSGSLNRARGNLYSLPGGTSGSPNQELEPTSDPDTAQGDRSAPAREATDLGATVSGAVAPSDALDRIKACRAAIRKEVQ